MRRGYLGQDPRPIFEANSLRHEGRTAGVVPLGGLWGDGELHEQVPRGLEWESLSQTYSPGPIEYRL